MRLRISVFLSAALTLCMGILAAPVLPAQPTEGVLTLRFFHKVGNQVLEFDTIKYTNAFGNRYGVSTLKYIVSDIVLQSAAGGSLLLEEQFYIDASDKKRCMETASMNVPMATYTNISFVFGLLEDSNRSFRWPNPPENQMEWPEPMGGGYHYMKLEGKFDSAAEVKNYQAHTGQLNGIPHFIMVSLPDQTFTLDAKGVTVDLIMDINEWWQNPHVIDLNNITGIMGNEGVQKQLMDNGKDVFSLGSIR